MASEQTSDSISSTTKMILNDCTALREIVGEVSLTRKMRQAEQSEITPLLSDLCIKDAYHGPLHVWLQNLSKTYGLLARVRTHIVINSDDNIKPHINDRSMDLPERNNPDINAAAVDKMQLQLDELVRSQYAQWQDKLKEWQELFVMQLMMNEITLSELEIENLSQLETPSELHQQFTDLAITPPKIKDERLSFADYFKLKVMLAAHSAWSRQHQAHDANAIEALLKKLKAEFKQITQQETEINNEFSTEVNQLIRI